MSKYVQFNTRKEGRGYENETFLTMIDDGLTCLHPLVLWFEILERGEVVLGICIVLVPRPSF